MSNQYVIGLDIGGTKCAVLLASVDNNIEILDKIRFDTRTDKGFNYAIDNLFEAIREILNKNNVDKKSVVSIGISCGGPLDSRKGIIMSPPNLKGWDNVPIVDMLQKEFGIPAYLQNDANACALAEWKLGAGKGSSNMIFLTMGTGMGAGLIIDGKLYSGPNDMAGEVGHIRLEEQGPEGYGKEGSFEGFCSGGGIGRLAQKRVRELIKSGVELSWCKTEEDVEKLNAKVIGDYAAEGDKNAEAIYEEVAEKLGKALAAFIDILNPELIVIGSIFARREELLRPKMEEIIEKEALEISRRNCRVVPAALGEKVGDLASIIVAAYGAELNLEEKKPVDEKVLAHLKRLMERYPVLEVVREDIFKAYEITAEAYRNNGKLLTCGNGGSAADSEHIVGELMKGFMKKRLISKEEQDVIKSIAGNEKGQYLAAHLQGALKAIALTQHAALSTAFLNDVAPDMIFAQQVYGYGVRGDVLVGLSTSGNSGNVVNAVMVAKAKGMKTIGLTGEGGGKLAELCDVAIKVPATITPDIQEFHLPIYHTLCCMLEEEFFK
jgi:glucokinase